MLEEKLEALWQRVSTYLSDHLLGALLLFLCGWFLIRLVVRLLKKLLGKTKMEQPFVSLISSVLRTVMMILLFLMTASRLGIDVTGVIALASVLTLAISLSLQSALGNIFGGFTLLHTKPFVEGDYVEIAGQSGTVREVGLAYTRLATPDNKRIFIPNSAVVAAEIINYSTTGTRRLAFDVTVDYNADPEAVIAALLEAGTVPAAMPDPEPFAAMSGFGEGTAKYTLRIWTTSDDYWPANFEIHKRIKAIFAEKGIAMSCEHVNVHVKQ